MPTLTALNTMSSQEARSAFRECCASTRWAEQMSAARPFTDAPAMQAAADRIWRTLAEEDWREAFAAHPRIGERETGVAPQHSVRSGAWSRGEQAAASTANRVAQDELERINREYEARFHRVYLVCASGRSAEDLLADARTRLRNDADTELRIAAEEQRRITELRLTKLLEDEA